MRFPVGSTIGRCASAWLLWALISCVAGTAQATPRPQPSPDERSTVIASLIVLYGQATDTIKPKFSLPEDYILSPTFADDGTLVEFAVEPKSGLDPLHSTQLSRPEFETLVANINSIKPLGELEEETRAWFVHGGRADGTRRYGNAYVETVEPISGPAPRPVTFAYIYYLHTVTGLAEIPGEPGLNDAGSFGLVCVDGKAYIAPKDEFLKVWHNRNKVQTLTLAGPTRSSCSQLP